MNDCLFCKIIKNEIPSYTIFEDEIVKVFLDISPSTNGDSLIIPKKHFNTIEDIDLETLNHINKISKQIYSLMKSKLNCEGMTFSQNNDLGQDIKHYHLHATPRYRKDNVKYDYNKKEIMPIDKVFEIIKKTN